MKIISIPICVLIIVMPFEIWNIFCVRSITALIKMYWLWISKKIFYSTTSMNTSGKIGYEFEKKFQKGQ